MQILRPLTVSAALFALLSISANATAEEALPSQGKDADRALSIEGENEESPRELYIIPWQDSRPENTDTEATRLLFDDLEPIDPEVFRRQIQYYTAPFDDQ